MTLAMSDSDLALLNIQENLKKYEKEVTLVRGWMRSPTLLGQVLRVLIRRVKYRDAPYSPNELQVLLLLSLAEMDPPGPSTNRGHQAGRI